MSKRNLSVAMLLAATLAVATAEPTVTLLKPPPDLYGIEDLWKADVQSDSKYDGVWFEGFVTEDAHGQVFWAKTDTFTLYAGRKQFGYDSVKVIQTDAAPGYEAFVTRTGHLPAGTYHFKLVLEPFHIPSPPNPPFIIRPMGPPRLIMPRDGDTIKVKYPQFVWTSPSPMPKEPVTYELRIWEVLPGQTKEEAAAANLPWFEQKNIRATSLTYPASARPLMAHSDQADSANTGNIAGKATDRRTGEGFCWQVAARRADRRQFVPLLSEVRSFWTSNGGGAPLGGKAEGQATIVWQHLGADGWEIWFADFAATPSPTIVGSPQLLCPDPGNNMDPAVACDRDGNTWVVWSHSDPGPDPHYEIHWSRRPAGINSWSPPAALAPIPAPQHQVDPAIALDSDGKGFCVWGQGRLWTDYGGGDGLFLHGSFWGGGGWSAEDKLPGLGDTCRLPEIVFTAAPATAQTPQTEHAAVVIATTHQTGTGSDVFRWTWDGSAWTDAARLPTTGGVVSQAYTGYLNPVAPTPAQCRIGIAPLKTKASGKYVVVAAWTREIPAAQTKLMACNGYCSGGAWTWSEFAAWFNNSITGATFHDPAVALSASSSHYLFVGPGTVHYKTPGAGSVLLIPPAGGSSGARPAVAWVDGTKPGPLAVWYDSFDIVWSYRKSGAWTPPAALSLTGEDLNPDVAATSGSHTMPVK